MHCHCVIFLCHSCVDPRRATTLVPLQTKASPRPCAQPRFEVIGTLPRTCTRSSLTYVAQGLHPYSSELSSCYHLTLICLYHKPRLRLYVSICQMYCRPRHCRKLEYTTTCICEASVQVLHRAAKPSDCRQRVAKTQSACP